MLVYLWYPNHTTANVFITFLASILYSITLFLLSLGGVDYSLPKHSHSCETSLAVMFFVKLSQGQVNYVPMPKIVTAQD